MPEEELISTIDDLIAQGEHLDRLPYAELGFGSFAEWIALVERILIPMMGQRIPG